MSGTVLSNLESKYREHYSHQSLQKLWPTEFVVRALLGKNYKFSSESAGVRALDLGFGDGRNLELLSSVFAEVYALEIADDICVSAAKKYPSINYITGFSHEIGTEDEFFDTVVAAHSIYYCDHSSFDNNLREVNRVLRTHGRFIFSVPKLESYLVSGSDCSHDEYALIKKDPLNLRNGTTIKYFSNEKSLEKALNEAGFCDVFLASLENDWWGIQEFCWVVSCKKAQLYEK